MNILRRVHDLFVPHARNNYRPHALGHKSLSFYAALMVSAKLITLMSLDLVPKSYAYSSAVTPDNILQLTNFSRQAFGLKPLVDNPELAQAAQAKADDMIKNQYFAHVSPQGLTPWDFIKSAGYNYIIAGENLAINFYTSEDVENAWMNSPDHKANILNKDFDDIGIAVEQGTYKGLKAMFVVQMFGSSIDQPYQTAGTYSVPQQNITAQAPGVIVPDPVQISLPAPIIAGDSFRLTNQSNYSISGYAQGADAVYVLVNHQPQAKFAVAQGSFSGAVHLNEGINDVRVVSYDNYNDASPISTAIQIKLDSSAPQLSGAQITPVGDGSGTAYMVQVQTQGDAAKIIASLDGQNTLLQPTSNPDVWQGVFYGNIADLKGRLSLNAYDLAGNSSVSSVADFNSSLQSSYPLIADSTSSRQISIFGATVPLHSFNLIYVYIAVFLLAALAVAIAIRKKIQHIDLIAHASALVAVALIFWIT
ncbi:hypothetical protein KGQ24_02865 [Patescibacteria group bacterium]|nr:hypothetical protein [Patescibacteria group bacterium]